MCFQMPSRHAVITFDEGTTYAGAEVRCLLRANVHEALEIARLSESTDDTDREGATRFFAERFVQSWNLEDEAGVPIPYTVETFLDQPIDFVMAIIRKWSDGIASVAPPLDEPSNDGLPSATPLTTAATP